MSFLKRIFGTGNKKTDEVVNEDLEKISSGKITKVYPILKPGDWVGIKAGALKQTLIGSQEDPKLVVGFGYDTPNNFVFLMPKDLEGKDPNQILQDAYSNLEEIESDFQISQKLEAKVLTASGNDFSAEKILSNKHMLRAHALLNAEELLVSIPRRRCMMVTSRSVDEGILKTFIALHQNVWQDDSYGNAPISNALFVVVGGQIKGTLSIE